MVGVTLLAVPCGYVGWQAKIVRERNATVKWLDTLQCRYYVFGRDPIKKSAEFEPTTTWPRRLLGDRDIFEIVESANHGFTKDELANLRQVFPEAYIENNQGHPL
jgi:hypothetical protein